MSVLPEDVKQAIHTSQTNWRGWIVPTIVVCLLVGTILWLIALGWEFPNVREM